MKLCTNFERNRVIRDGIIAIWTFDLMTFDHVLRVAVGSVIIFTKFDLRQLIGAWNYSVFDADTLCHAVTLTINLLTLNFFGVSRVYTVHKIWAKSNIWQLSYWRFSTFLPCNVRGWDSFTDWFSGMCGLNITKLGKDIGRLSQHCTFVSEFGYLAAFSNAGG